MKDVYFLVCAKFSGCWRKAEIALGKNVADAESIAANEIKDGNIDAKMFDTFYIRINLFADPREKTSISIHNM